MRKIFLVLAVFLLVSPAWAAVTIDANRVGDVNQVEITYTTDGNLPRGFALDITVDSGNTIVEISDYNIGECNSTVKGYGIFIGSIDINSTSNEVNDWGNPVASGNGALGGLTTGGITIEMGSLYTDSNAPPTSGTLCRIRLSKVIDCNVALALDTTRGGLVMENPDEQISPTLNDLFFQGGCYNGPDWQEWHDLVGEPNINSWCYVRQCHGDADGQTEQVGKLTFHVGWVDLDIFLAAWQDKVLDYAADFDHTSEQVGKLTFRVGWNDLGVFLANWQDKIGTPPDCQTYTPVSP